MAEQILDFEYKMPEQNMAQKQTEHLVKQQIVTTSQFCHESIKLVLKWIQK